MMCYYISRMRVTMRMKLNRTFTGGIHSGRRKEWNSQAMGMDKLGYHRARRIRPLVYAQFMGFSGSLVSILHKTKGD